MGSNLVAALMGRLAGDHGSGRPTKDLDEAILVDIGMVRLKGPTS